jgi:uncharacterized protein
MTMPPPGGRVRAYFEFLLAILYFFAAKLFAQQAARGFSENIGAAQFSPLIEQAGLAFLLLVGYATLGFAFDRQARPVAAQGWPFRAGWRGEAGLGLAAGWGLAVACVLPLAVVGGIAVRFSKGWTAWGWLAADTGFFAAMALAEEVAFRGYAFQRFAKALGSLGAVIIFAAFYGILQSFLQGSGSASVSVAVALSLLLSTAYLRTRALWLSWGVNFAWKASRGLLFGLAVCGDNSHSPIVQGDPMGPFWLTGGGFGVDGTWVTLFVILAGVPVIYRLTRDLDFKYNAPVIVPAGIPVDIDAGARAQHEAAMGLDQPAAPALVQIQASLGASIPMEAADTAPPVTGNETR